MIITSTQAKDLHLGDQIRNVTDAMQVIAHSLVAQKQQYSALALFLEKQAGYRDLPKNPYDIKLERLKQLKFTLNAYSEAIELLNSEFEEYQNTYDTLERELQRLERLAKIYHYKTGKTKVPKKQVRRWRARKK